MKKLNCYFLLMILVSQAFVPVKHVSGQAESVLEVPAGLHLALLDATAREAEPLQPTPDGYALQGHGLDVKLADGHFSA